MRLPIFSNNSSVAEQIKHKEMPIKLVAPTLDGIGSSRFLIQKNHSILRRAIIRFTLFVWSASALRESDWKVLYLRKCDDLATLQRSLQVRILNLNFQIEDRRISIQPKWFRCATVSLVSWRFQDFKWLASNGTIQWKVFTTLMIPIERSSI